MINDSQIFIAIILALIPAVLALKLAKELN
nr:photosystem I protein M [Galdieria phlegrea]WDA99823.1 photosystem I protein M [Galdieria phlegrea]